MRNLILIAALMAAPVAWAEDAALILGIERYEQLGRLSRGAEIVDAAAGLAGLGFAVTALPNGRAAPTAEALEVWAAAVPEADRLVVALSGRFATDGRRTWLLTAEADAPGLLALGAEAVSVDSLLTVLGARPGRAVLLLGTVEAAASHDAWLREGIGTLDIPQGVTVLRGEPRDIAGFVASGLTVPEGDLIALARATRGLTLAGFVPAELIFMPAEPPPAEVPEAPEAPPPDTGAEQALWDGAVALDTVEAYRNYLVRYPRGRFATEAEDSIAAILAEPDRDARLAEEAIGLSRDGRRDVQRNLTLLGYNTRGIDGLFGPGTRGAITNWQQQNGFPQTSYLTPEQIDRLVAQAARRAAELEAEAARQRADEVRRDRAFWEETGAVGDEPGLRAYLERFPDGLFTEVAGERLAAIEEQKRAQAAAEDRGAWDAARAADSVAAYQDYVRAFPNGLFQAEAVARIGELNSAEDAAAEERVAAEAEAALALNPLTLRLIESRLEQLGLDPGAVDGLVDDDMRRALRQFQRDRNLSATGFVDEEALIRLLADMFEHR